MLPRESSHYVLGRNRIATGARSLRPRILDESPRLLRDSYALRFRVYCQELGFLPAANYSDGLERDEYDGTAAHVGATDESGTLCGTARVIVQGPNGHLPALDHCSVFPEQRHFWKPPYRLVEVSRMCVRPPACGDQEEGRRASRFPVGQVFDTILMAAYLASCRLGATHWLGATEAPLHRLLLKRGYPFFQAGPVGDYYGPVAIYLMDLAEFGQRFSPGRAQDLADYAVDTGAA